MTSLNKPKESVFHLECPACAQDNEIRVENPITCPNCSQDMKDNYFSKKVPGATVILSGSILLGAGFFGFQSGEEANDYSAQNYATVYKVMDMCVRGETGRRTKQMRDLFTDICSCAIDHAVRDLDDIEYAGVGYEILVSKMDATVEEC